MNSWRQKADSELWGLGEGVGEYLRFPDKGSFPHVLEKEMAAHSSILAWEIPWTEEPGGLQFMGWQRVGCDSVTQLKPHV